MYRGLSPSFSLLTLSLFTLTLAACGGGGSDTNNENSAGGGTGTVGVLLTDAPADPADFVAINVDIEKIELLRDDNDDDEAGRVTLFEGDDASLDLLRLRHESIPFSFADGVPVGSYCKVRLTLAESGLELVLTDSTPDDLSDNPREYPNLPGNRKLDLNIRDCIDIEAGQTLALQLDIDARRSIHVVGGGRRYQFRPVVFVDAVTEDFDPKLVRLDGRIAAFDEEQNQILLCDALPDTRLDNAACVILKLDEHSALFDNLTQNGAPVAVDTLFDESQIGAALQVVGWPRRPSLLDTIPTIDIDVLPDAGECIVWSLYMPAATQPLPIACELVPATLPANTIVVDANGVADHALRALMRVDALVLKQGDFVTIEGNPVADADSAGFTMALPPQPTVLRDPLPVTLQPTMGAINGTRIVDKQGQLYDAAAIETGTSVEVDGVLMHESLVDMWLNAALVIIDDAPVSSAQTTGIIADVDGDTLTLTLDDTSLCGQTLTALTFAVTDTMQIMTITIEDEMSSVSLGGTPALGQEAGVNGRCSGSVFEAQSLILVDDLRS